MFLGPGDLLCMFTDGLVEARDATDLFGTERVAALLTEEAGSSVDELAARLVAEARTFHGGRDLSDDLALLVLRVREPSEGVRTSEAADAAASGGR